MRKIQLLIACSDTGYTEHLSRVIAKRYSEEILVSISTNAERFRTLTESQEFDIALIEPQMLSGVKLNKILLPLVLHDTNNSEASDGTDLELINKYQRISNLLSTAIEKYSNISVSRSSGGKRAGITAVWSPAGGCGKTTVALAYATNLIACGHKTMYLDLEPFSSSPLYFAESGKSISTVLEKLDTNVEVLIQGIRQQDSASGIYYLCHPDNYDDLSILTLDDVKRLIEGCASGVDELVIDMGSDCNQINRFLMEQSDVVMMVSDGSQACLTKCGQFCTQSTTYQRIIDKLVVVSNKGAHKNPIQGVRIISLPLVQSSDPIIVYKTLSAGYFSDR